MSNIGKQRILVPDNVKIKCNGWKIHAMGKYGQVSINFPIHTQLILERNYLRILAPYLDSALYGSLQTKVKAIIHGLSLPYVRSLQFVGVGYRPIIQNDLLIIRLGYSHEVKLAIPKDLNVTIVKKNNLRIAGSDLESVCQYAYRVRSFRPPEPFKGKGIVCLGEKVRRKEGKKKEIVSMKSRLKSYKFKKRNLPQIIENNKVIFNSLQPNLRSTPIIEELISLGAFVGDLSKKTDLSQYNLIKGYRNNISFYDIAKSMDLLTKATRFLKSLKKKENINFIVVANSSGNDTQSIYDFKQIKHRKVQFFTQKSWPPGYISKTKDNLNTVLVVDDITLNRVAFEEGVNAKIPVVAFLSPGCNLNGVDYPVPLNLKNNRIWFVNYCKTLLKNKK